MGVPEGCGASYTRDHLASPGTSKFALMQHAGATSSPGTAYAPAATVGDAMTEGGAEKLFSL